MSQVEDRYLQDGDILIRKAGKGYSATLFVQDDGGLYVYDHGAGYSQREALRQLSIRMWQAYHKRSEAAKSKTRRIVENAFLLATMAGIVGAGVWVAHYVLSVPR